MSRPSAGLALVLLAAVAIIWGTVKYQPRQVYFIMKPCAVGQALVWDHRAYICVTPGAKRP